MPNVADRAEAADARRKTGLQISVHEDTGAILIRVVDQSTGEVLREIPPEAVLNGLRFLLHKPRGLLIDQTS
ncbi:MAG: flagellar protein FlaG [Armatimonadota bacterium]